MAQKHSSTFDYCKCTLPSSGRGVATHEPLDLLNNHLRNGHNPDSPSSKEYPNPPNERMQECSDRVIDGPIKVVELGDITKNIVVKTDKALLTIDGLGGAFKVMRRYPEGDPLSSKQKERTRVCTVKNKCSACLYFLLRRYVISRLGIDIHDSNSWSLPDTALAKLYNSCSIPFGPSSEKLLVDWDMEGRTPWTVRCSTILANEFQRRIQGGEYPELLEGNVPSIYQLIQWSLTFLLYTKQSYLTEDHTVRSDLPDALDKSDEDTI
ncbi:hypothetical protein M408DRAFT_267408 [Serendipita vermifera MAFF 305830]|uniref:Uncharacterized protein n=1 Tax=Serendipita vermifera MAFF 305830 TaxID=933852 RepID=A0A0C2W9N7_SERVB|nr:hypothetical protein M408DRAFT_267408 [Serendipita vermifera MAFF 305830]